MLNGVSLCTAALACAGLVAGVAARSNTAVSAPLVASLETVSPEEAGDVIVEWHQIFNDAVLATSPAPNSLVTSRSAALVSAAVFDAVNGVHRRYAPLLVEERAPERTSAASAAVQAACVMLMRLYPAQAASLTTRREQSLAALAAGDRHGPPDTLERGIAWGQAVADAIWVIRDKDGFTPTMAPFTGAPTLGFWRPTPPANSPGSGPQFATMTPWVLLRPSQFRPAPPHALSSPEYAADYNETRMKGSATGSIRTTEDSNVAVFWNGNGTLLWTRVAIQLADTRQLRLADAAHAFAVLHVAMADASLATWDAKYRYLLWRPVTAIRSLDNDGNDATSPDPSWTPFLTTSAHPEYPSGHSNLAGAAAAVLAAIFGEDASFDATSEMAPGATRSFVGFDDAVAEMADARVFGGMHFRTACVRGSALGRSVAEYVMSHAMQSSGADGVH